jgi:hypothetical protein
MTDPREYLKDFIRAAVQRGRQSSRRGPALRVALDALEAVALGAVDELFERLPKKAPNKPRARARRHTH